MLRVAVRAVEVPTVFEGYRPLRPDELTTNEIRKTQTGMGSEMLLTEGA